MFPVTQDFENRKVNEKTPVIAAVCQTKENLDAGKVSLELLLEVHGGVTYADKWKGRDGWWLGFDCGHCDDYQPHFDSLFVNVYSRYRTLEYVADECRSLARQIVDYTQVSEARGTPEHDGPAA